MEIITELLGKNGIIVAFGILIFILVYRNSIKVFQWIEDQTLGTKDYIQEKLELLFIDIKEKHIVITLLTLSFGKGLLALGTLSLLGQWVAGIFVGFIFGFVGWKIPKPFINYMVAQRVSKYQTQMVDALNLLANGIRAGLSVPQSLAMVVDELPPPVSQEFNMILQQNKIGVPLEECFENLLKRVPTEDNEMFVTSVNILRETGGNLAETFDTIVFVIRERIRIQQKIDTYVAQGKFQGIIIFLMPFAMAGIYTSSDPEAMMRVFAHPLGIILLIVALGFDLVGGFVISKIIKIDV